MAYLIVLKGQNAKESISLEKDRIVLGRNANCDIVFPANDFAVSREHACILRMQSKFYLEDMGSRNGTFLNNQQVTNPCAGQQGRNTRAGGAATDHGDPSGRKPCLSGHPYSREEYLPRISIMEQHVFFYYMVSSKG